MSTTRMPHTLRRNLIIFTISIVDSGWVGIAIDKLTGQPDYQDVATLNGGGTLGMGVWTVAPLLVVIALRTFCGDGWKNAGYALNVRGNGWLYALSIAVYPATTYVVILLGTQVGAMHVAALNMSAVLTLIASQFVIQCAKNFFEESLWRGYLTNQLLKLTMSDWKLYLIAGLVWWAWHLPYWLIMLNTKEVESIVPAGRIVLVVAAILVFFCWNVMFTEIFRVTRSIWPLVLAHALEDAVTLPLLIDGTITLDPRWALVFSTNTGLLPAVILLSVGLGIRRWRIKKPGQSKRVSLMMKHHSQDVL